MTQVEFHIAALMCYSGLTSPGRALYVYRRALR
jgi:hypothetical protein